MKKLPLLLFFSFVLISCGVKLPASYYEKSLKEPNYLENNQDNYTLYVNPLTTPQIYLEDSAESLKQTQTDHPIVLKDVKHRPCFHLYSGQDTLILSNRHIAFDQVINFRDIGGLKTIEGKTIRWGKIYRSDNLSGLEKHEFSRFNDLAIATVYDLRTESEIKGKEDRLPEKVSYVHFPTVKDKGDLLTQLKGKVLSGEISEEESVKLTLDLYRGSVMENLPAFRALIHKITASDKPVLYHCSAGKDRTGITTALILSILKVDRQTIINEYLLSNYYRRAKMEKMLGRARLAKVIKPHLSLQVIENFMKVDARYLNAAFDTIDQQYGGMEAFIKNELGISDTLRTQLISKLTY